MWPALSIAPSVTNMPDQFSCSIIAIAASATQTSPPRCAVSVPGKKRSASSGYMKDGNAVSVP